jgi:hypothetical protein
MHFTWILNQRNLPHAHHTAYPNIHTPTYSFRRVCVRTKFWSALLCVKVRQFLRVNTDTVFLLFCFCCLCCGKSGLLYCFSQSAKKLTIYRFPTSGIVELSWMERSQVEWSQGVDLKWSQVEWSGVKWSGVQWSGVEWSGMKGS